MTFHEIMPEARIMIAQKNRHYCPLCQVDVQRKAAAFSWVFRCPTHGIDCRTTSGAALAEMFGSANFTDLGTFAETGASILELWAYGEGRGDLGPVEMLTFLTTWHRRSSPPSLSEQPRPSLQARRENHDFLTTPIIRQVVVITVPEYDLASLVLAKPVRPSLHGLARSSLMQAYALTVGIGRLIENPADQAITVLLASDELGEARLRLKHGLSR